MLISKSGPITNGFSLLTAGETCVYFAGLAETAALFDTGASVHIAGIFDRLAQSDLTPEDINYVFPTNLTAERIGGLPYLRKAHPGITVIGTGAMKKSLADDAFKQAIYAEDKKIAALYPTARAPATMSEEEYCSLLHIDKVYPINENITLEDEISVRIYSTPGHTSESLSYLISPLDILVGDLGFGYFRGKSLATPGGNVNLEQALQSIQGFKDIEFSALCLPLHGVITGTQVQKHLENIQQNTEDLKKECLNALTAGVKDEDILASLDEWFFIAFSEDPIVSHCMNKTKAALWKQLKEQHQE